MKLINQYNWGLIIKKTINKTTNNTNELADATRIEWINGLARQEWQVKD